MDKVFQKCGICLVKKTKQIWFPFKTELWFSEDPDDIDAEDSVQICRNCTLRMYLLMRSDAEAFSEALTIQDVIMKMRKVFRL